MCVHLPCKYVCVSACVLCMCLFMYCFELIYSQMLRYSVLTKMTLFAHMAFAPNQSTVHWWLVFAIFATPVPAHSICYLPASKEKKKIL